MSEALTVYGSVWAGGFAVGLIVAGVRRALGI